MSQDATSSLEPTPPANWRLGTMGFSYDDWSGPFYPRGVRSGDWLIHYAKFFDTVELDTTFYAAPTAERVARWVGVTPEEFRFCLKTPRAITHEAPLAKGVEAMSSFLDVVRGFGAKLGVVLIQFAPTFTADRFDEVDTFLTALPGDIRFAVEFRHRSWGTREALKMVAERKCSFVAAEYASKPARVFATADFLYVRWIGIHNRFPEHKAELIDVSGQLAWWRDAIAAAVPKAPTVWGFFNNDYAGYGPATANRFKRMIGLPTTKPIPESPTLFDKPSEAATS